MSGEDCEERDQSTILIDLLLMRLDRRTHRLLLVETALERSLVLAANRCREALVARSAICVDSNKPRRAREEFVFTLGGLASACTLPLRRLGLSLAFAFGRLDHLSSASKLNARGAVDAIAPGGLLDLDPNEILCCGRRCQDGEHDDFRQSKLPKTPHGFAVYEYE